MKICKAAAIVALFIIINIYCCAVWADKAAEPVLSFELEDGTQVLNQDNVIKASLIRLTVKQQRRKLSRSFLNMLKMEQMTVSMLCHS